MKFMYLKFIIFLLLPLSLIAQQEVEVTYEQKSDNTYVFKSTNRMHCDFWVKVEFTHLQNLRGSTVLPYEGIASPGTSNLFTLKPMQEGGPSTFQYTYRYRKGRPDPNVNMSIVYLMPVAPGKKSQVMTISYLGEMAGESKPKDWYALGFKMQAGDTVFAARRGKVSAAYDAAQIDKENLVYARDDNYVEIEHEDHSFGIYQLFRNGGVFAKPGQVVEAGEPLGIIGGENYQAGPHLRFSVFYSHLEKVYRNKEETDRQHYWAYVPVHFYTENNPKVLLLPNKTYTSFHPETVITQEMNKRDLKRWQKH